MTTARNDITGDALRTKTITTAYSEGYDRIFGNKKQKQQLAADIAEANQQEDAEEAHRVA